MGLLSDSNARQVREMFAAMTRDVPVRLYTQKLGCQGCDDTERILDELAGLGDRLRLEKLNPLIDTSRGGEDGIERVPAIVIGEGRARFYGTPSGYEFTTLLTALVDAGSGEENLDPATTAFLSGLDRDLVMKVFVTPTCPYCPASAVLALRMAMACPRVKAEVVEANEFPEVSARYGVQGVPRTVVNDLLFAEGALPEASLVRALTAALPGLDGLAGPRSLASFLAGTEEDGQGG